MKLKQLSAFFLVLSINLGFAQGLEIPQIFEGEQITNHSAYTTSYSHKHGQPHWVAYSLESNKLNAVAKRPSRFQPDPNIKPSTTSHNSYTKTGFDRGHLAPAADMAWSIQTMKESFYTSNICPQRPAFNRGIWKVLESSVRNWTYSATSTTSLPHLFIVTGPVITENAPNISRTPNHTLSVPEFFFKAVIDTVGKKRGVAFLIPNKKIPSEQLWNYAISIDELEQKLGRDLFPGLEDKIEVKIEAQFRKSDWE